MALSAVSTRWNRLTVFCAATLALSGCSDSKGNSKVTDPIVAQEDGGDDNGGKPSDTNGAPTGPALADLGDNVAGKECKASADCDGDNAECAMVVGGFAGMGGTPAPGGYCSGPCTADTDCGKGGACAGAIPAIPIVLPDGLPGACQGLCNTDSDCRPEYFCNIPAAGGGMGGGTPGGTTGMGPGGMGPGAFAPPVACQPKPVVAKITDQVGAACMADADCGTKATCAMGSIGGGPGATAIGDSYCTGPCLMDSDCGTGGVCIGANGNAGAGNCYLDCETLDADCGREGYYCGVAGRLAFGNNVIQEGGNACVLKPEPVPEGGMPDATVGSNG